MRGLIRRQWFRVLGILAGLGVLQGVGQEVIYDNSENFSNTFYRFSREHGDEIEVAGLARRVVRFSFRYYGDVPTNSPGTYRLRFYANDGRDRLPARQTGQMPGTILWESSAFPILSGLHNVVLDVPEVDVPDRFTWTVIFMGIPGTLGNSAGLILADPPVVGRPLGEGRVGSYWDAWVKNVAADDNSWNLINFGFTPSQPKANFYAKIEAIVGPPRPYLAALIGPSGVQLHWNSEDDEFYAIEYTDNFPTGPWELLGQKQGEGGLGILTDPEGASAEQRYYRLVPRTFPVVVPVTLQPASGELVLKWTSVPGAEYTIESSDTVGSQTWDFVRRVFTSGVNGQTTVESSGSGMKFFRIWRSR